MFKRSTKFLLLTGIIFTHTLQLNGQEQDSLTSVQVDSLAQISSKKTKGPLTQIKVIDGNTGKPLSGVSVSIPLYTGSITDEKGGAKISTPNPDALVIIASSGYETKELYLKRRSSATVKLFESENASSFGKMNYLFAEVPKSTVPFAVSSVKNVESWKENAKETPDTYLQGKIAGLNSIRRSGTPGVGANLFLRGYQSLYTDNQPLLVVDGVIFNNSDANTLFSGFHSNALENIDVKDIQEITVIKDAGASVYGTKGANGVILISTRKAASEDTKIDFGSFAAFNSRASTLPVMGASDYRLYLSGLLQSSNLSQAQMAALPYFKLKPAGSADEYYKYQFGTNWQKEVIDNGYNQNYHLNVSGGDNIAKYNLSLGYVDGDGQIKNTGLTRYFTRFNSDFAFSKKFTATTNLAFSTTQHTLLNQGGAYKTSPLFLGLTKAPFMSPKEVGAGGQLSPNFAFADAFGISNPSAIVSGMDAVSTNYRVTASGTLHYKINSKYTVQTQLGIAYDKIRDRLFIPSRGVAIDTLETAVIRNQLGSNTNRQFAIFNDSRISYAKNISHLHQIAANVGIRFKQDRYESDYGLTYNSSTDEYRSLSGGNAGLRDVGGQISKMRWINTYANVDYSYRNKYFLSFNTAVDGSSRFGKNIPNALNINGNKLAVLPSLGAAWLLSSESFLRNNAAVDLLKLRLSYGLTGNDDIGDYAARAYYVPQSLYGLQGYSQGNVGNTALKWETVEKLNVGLDFSAFKERLSISIDAYRNYTYDMLTYDELSPEAGFAASISNGGEMRTNGIDLQINSRLIDKKIKWDAGLSISHYQNKVTKLNSGDIQTSYNGARILTRVGLPANVFFGYKTNGVYSTTEEATASKTFVNPSAGLMLPVTAGDVRFVNMMTDSKEDIQNGVHVINGMDRDVIGDPNPDFTGAFSNALSFKNWSLGAIFTFSYGNDVYNGLRNELESQRNYQNQLISVNNRWRTEGQVTNTPKSVMGDPSQNSRFSDRWIEDGSYLRLRTLTLSYNFVIRNNTYLKTLKVYGNANNVFTLSKYLGYDPEFSSTRRILGQGVDAGWEPQFRTVQLGVKIGI
jgi:TonB-linked SusC/RagA family outer membrane protein